MSMLVRLDLLQMGEPSLLGACTIRFLLYTEHPSTVPGAYCSVAWHAACATSLCKQALRSQPPTGLAHLESIDEEAIIYIRAANETAQAQLMPIKLAQSLVSIEAFIRQVWLWATNLVCPRLPLDTILRVHAEQHHCTSLPLQAGVNSTILVLSAVADPAPAVIASQLAAGDIAPTRPSSVLSVAYKSLIVVNFFAPFFAFYISAHVLVMNTVVPAVCAHAKRTVVG
jgi:hypothetical protein